MCKKSEQRVGSVGRGREKQRKRRQEAEAIGDMTNEKVKCMSKLKAKRLRAEGRMSQELNRKKLVGRKTEMELLCHKLRRHLKFLSGLRAFDGVFMLRLSYMW